jgi:predicted nuclease of restriction endonuclease-like RecB superfamily
VEITGPAAPFIVRTARYGVRLARVIPALVHAPGWRLEAEVRRGDAIVHFRLRGRARASAAKPPLGAAARRASYDSTWERSLAAEFRQRFKAGLGDWTLSRETAPVTAGDELFLPDFTLRHIDGREALVEIVGFWTADYLESKARKVAAAGLDNLILVVYRGLAVGKALDALTNAAGFEHIVWFTNRPRAAEVVRAAEQWARQ